MQQVCHINSYPFKPSMDEHEHEMRANVFRPSFRIFGRTWWNEAGRFLWRKGSIQLYALRSTLYASHKRALLLVRKDTWNVELTSAESNAAWQNRRGYEQARQVRLRMPSTNVCASLDSVASVAINFMTIFRDATLYLSPLICAKEWAKRKRMRTRKREVHIGESLPP